MDRLSAIIEALEREIDQLPTGTRLPSEHDLMARFAASRATVRKALSELERRFLLRRTQGSGTFVNRQIDYLLTPRLAPSLHETAAAAGARIRTFVTDVSYEPAPDPIAERLEVEGPVWRLERIGYLNDELATYAQEWLSPDCVPDIADRVRAAESITDVLRDAGCDPTRSWTRVDADFSPPAMTERLDRSDPISVWRLETVTRNGAHGPVLMASRGWLRQDRISVAIEFGV